MEPRRLWTWTLKNNIDGGGVMAPVLDPFDPSAFYVSDGWGSYYGSMRLRRLSLETGEELASALTRDAVRCLWAGEDAIFAVLTKRVVKVARPSMEVLGSWKKGVPAGSDYVAFDGEKTLLLMNWAASYLSVLELGEEAKARRKRLENCCGIFREDPRRFLVMNGSGIYRCALPEGALKKLADTGPCCRCLRGDSGRLWLLGTEEDGRPRMVIYPPPGADGAALAPEGIFPVPRPWEEEEKGITRLSFALSRDEETVYFTRDAALWAWSVPEERLLFYHAFQDEYVLAVFDTGPGGVRVLTYNWSQRRLSGQALEG